MKKKLILASCIVLAAALTVTLFPVISPAEIDASNPTYAFGLFDFLNEGQNADPNAESTDSDIGEIVSSIYDDSNSGAGAVIGDLIDGIAGDADIVGGLGNIIGGLFDGLGGSNTTAPQVPGETYEINTIAPIVTVSETQATTQATTQPVTESTTEISTEAVTYDFASGVNPFDKPDEALPEDAEGDGVKWLQWIFVYTNYGLQEQDITGKLDEKTVALVKKLQLERGLEQDGIVSEEVIDKAELLMYETRLGAGNTGQYIEPSVSIEVTASDGSAEKEKSSKITLLVIILAVVWALVVAGIIVFFVMKKKRLAKDIDALEKEIESKKSEGEKSYDKKSEDEKSEDKKSEDEKSEDEKSEEKKPESSEKPQPKETAEKKSGEIGSIADLFEEANNSNGKKRRGFKGDR